MRDQGFIHPATLVPSELEYVEGYNAIMDVLKQKMKPLEDGTAGGQKKKSYEDPD